MGTRDPGTASPRGRTAALGALAVLAVVPMAACGSKSFPNNPRPPAPIEISAKVDAKRVVVSPDRFGAGLVNFTVANLSDSPIDFTITGPRKRVSSGEIEPGAPGYLKANLKEGDYQATAGQGAHAAPASIKVGPERKSSQNKLLQP